MNTDEIELSKELVKDPNWTWTDGMPWFCPVSKRGGIGFCNVIGGVFDLDHPSALGWLYAILRETPQAVYVQLTGDAEDYSCVVGVKDGDTISAHRARTATIAVARALLTLWRKTAVRTYTITTVVRMRGRASGDVDHNALMTVVENALPPGTEVLSCTFEDVVD